MHSTWSIILSGFLALLGFVLLIKSVARLISIYATSPQIEWSAQSPAFNFSLAQPGSYAISIKRSSAFGVIPANNSFKVNNRDTGESIPISNYSLLIGRRTGLSGSRIVPVANFTIQQPGSFQLINPVTERFTEKDKLVIETKAGLKGALMIIATVLSGVLFIVGSIFFTLLLLKK
jgi:hypothetical protein